MFLKVVSIENPYLQMQLLRLLTACFSLITIHFFIKKTQQQFEEGIYRNIYYILSYGLWFLPFLSVRFSSETIAALCFIWAWIIYNKPMKYQPILIGVFLGLSFLFRFQMAFAMLRLGLWWILIEKVKISFLVQVGLIFGLLLLIGTGIDSWFYGEFVFSPWKYFYANIVEGVASSFGTSPWYDYFVQIDFE